MNSTEAEPDRRIVKVLTNESGPDIIAKGVVGNWKADEERLARCEYVVCVRNAKARFAPPDVPHGAAFLVGKVIGAMSAGDGRVQIVIDEYWTCSIRDVWNDKSQNPVRYLTKTLAEKQLGLSFADIPFQDVPSPVALEANPASTHTEPLTIPQAKAGLAKTLGIKPEQIEIIIKG